MITHSLLTADGTGKSFKTGKTRLGRARFVAGVLTLLLAGALLLTAFGHSATARPQPTWQLVDYRQKSCISLDVTNPDTLYGVWIRGSWTHSITAGLDDAPAGAAISGYYLPISPGSSDGVGSLAYVTIAIPASTPTGIYTMNLWADDGTTRETVPVRLRVAQNCSPY